MARGGARVSCGEMVEMFEVGAKAKWWSVVAAMVALVTTYRVEAYVIAADDASQASYNDGWSTSDNGGTGFLPWSFLGQENTGTGFGGTFRSSDNPEVNIGSGSNNYAFGVYGNQGGVGAAVRPFASPLAVGSTFAIDMDNQGVDGGGGKTVGFSLRNSSGNNLAEFYFIGGQSNYTVNASNVSGTTPGWTTGGLRLSFTLGAANSFTMTIDQLNNGLGVDHTVTGSLFSNANQGISQVRLFNSNGGPDVFFNNLEISAVPEASVLLFGGIFCGIMGITYAVRTTRRGQLIEHNFDMPVAIST